MRANEVDADLMALLEEYGELREWHGARPGDDAAGKLDLCKARLMARLEELTAERDKYKTFAETFARRLYEAGLIKDLSREVPVVVVQLGEPK